MEAIGKIKKIKIELPCIVIGNGEIDAFGEVRVPYYQVLWLDKFGMVKLYKTTDSKEAEKRLEEVQGENNYKEREIR